MVQDGMARGLLGPVEGSERMAAAFAAVHLRDLGPLTADLPQPPVSAPSGWRALLVMFLEQLQASLRTAITGPRRPAQIGAALLVGFLLISCGLLAAHAVFAGFDTGGHDGPNGFGPPRHR